MTDMRGVELSGSARAMGEGFGEAFADDIRRFTHGRIDRLAEFVAKYDPGRSLSRDDMLGLAGGTVEAHQRLCPAIWEEFEGIARAANLSVAELLIGNGFTDFRDFVLLQNPALRGQVTEGLGECTAFLAPAGVADGHPIVGQTWDMNAHARDFLVLVRRRPDDAPATLGLTTVGCLCLIGMNSEGVSVGNTNVVPTDARLGVNYLFTITNALRCRSAEAAADAIEATPRLSGHNYYVADTRQAINLETTATRCCRTVVEREVFVHANHYVDPSLKALEFARQDLTNSQGRHARLAANFVEQASPLSVETCWAQFADVVQGGPDTPPSGVATLATVVQCPATHTLHVCAGGPTPGNVELLMV